MLNKPRPNSGNVVSQDALSDTLREYIQSELLPLDCSIELKNDDDLLNIGYLDSMQFMRLVQFSEETFALTIPPGDLLIENFQSVNSLSGYLITQLSS